MSNTEYTRLRVSSSADREGRMGRSFFTGERPAVVDHSGSKKCGEVSEYASKYLDMCGICVNTHTHTHMAPPLFRAPIYE